MKITKQVISLSFAAAFLASFISSNASSMPLSLFKEQAPRSSVEICVAQIGKQANYDNAGRIRHDVDSRKRRISGYRIKVDTTVFGEGGDDVIREYSTVCLITDNEVTKQFRIEEKGV